MSNMKLFVPSSNFRLYLKNIYIFWANLMTEQFNHHNLTDLVNSHHPIKIYMRILVFGQMRIATEAVAPLNKLTSP